MARQLARRQRRERLAGVLIAVIGIAVLIVAVLALRNPKEASTRAGSDTRTVTSSVTANSPASSTPPSSSASHSTSGSSSTSPSTSASRSAPRAIGSQPLIVLNDTVTPNLARDAARRFERGGWKVTSFDEGYSNTIVSTCAYYDPSIKGAKAAALALQRQYPTIKRVVARFSPLPTGPVVVILTTDYSPS